MDWYKQARNNSEFVSSDQRLHTLLKLIVCRWPDDCPVDRMLDFALATYGANNFSELRLEQLDILCESADMVLNRHMSELRRAKKRSWNDFVKSELLKGGAFFSST